MREEPSLKDVMRSENERVAGGGIKRGGFQNEVCEVGPRSWCYPVVFLFLRLGASEAVRIGDAESANSSDILKGVVVDSSWHEAITEGDGKAIRIGDFVRVGGVERDKGLRS